MQVRRRMLPNYEAKAFQGPDLRISAGFGRLGNRGWFGILQAARWHDVTIDVDLELKVPATVKIPA